MIDKMILPLVGGGVAIYAVSTGMIGGPAVVKAKAPPNEMGAPLAVVNTNKMTRINSTNNGVLAKPGTGLLDPYGLDQFVSQMGSDLTAGLKQKYDMLSSDARKQGAAILNDKLKLNPPLTGNEGYKEVSARVGATAGGAAGAAVCGAVSFGSAAPLCAIGGAYIGQTLAPVVAEYTKKATTATVKAVASTAKKVYNKLKFW
jgi:hypothetical protein